MVGPGRHGTPVEDGACNGLYIVSTRSDSAALHPGWGVEDKPLLFSGAIHCVSWRRSEVYLRDSAGAQVPICNTLCLYKRRAQMVWVLRPPQGSSPLTVKGRWGR